MNKIFAIMILSVVMTANPALAMVCKSTHSKNYEATLDLDQFGKERVSLRRIKPHAAIEFYESDLQSVRTHGSVTYKNYVDKQLAANLFAKLNISFVSGRATHIFLTLKNNLSAWNEPLKCK